MSYYLLIQGKIIKENDIIDLSVDEKEIDTTPTKVLEINPKSQSFTVRLQDFGSVLEIPINIWDATSIIEEGKETDPNIIFKLKRANI